MPLETSEASPTAVPMPTSIRSLPPASSEGLGDVRLVEQHGAVGGGSAMSGTGRMWASAPVRSAAAAR